MLQHFFRHGFAKGISVSIPNRDLSMLQPLGAETLSVFSFQGSLPGDNHQVPFERSLCQLD